MSDLKQEVKKKCETIEDVITNLVKKRSSSSYNGIIRKFTPKWMGWKYIDYLKSLDINVKNLDENNQTDLIHLNALDQMSINYYTIIFMNEKFN